MATIENASFTNADHTGWDAVIDGVHWGGAVDGTLWDVIVESGVRVADYAAPAATWDGVRAKRNALLAGTDFHALSDVPMSDGMASYRQALRDVPANNDDPNSIDWPVLPG